jgi:hypothetical protein
MMPRQLNDVALLTQGEDHSCSPLPGTADSGSPAATATCDPQSWEYIDRSFRRDDTAEAAPLSEWLTDAAFALPRGWELSRTRMLALTLTGAAAWHAWTIPLSPEISREKSWPCLPGVPRSQLSAAQKKR